MAWEILPQGYIRTIAKITKGAVLEYYGHEMGITDHRANQKIEVHRMLDELSKAETLKSFEGMPLTMTHPDDKEVKADDWKQKTVGHIQNVRIEGNYVVCDAYIQDKSAIELLKDKDIRELSVGYEPADIQERGGKFYHQNIRANHVAIVAEGRVGSDCRLQDSKQKRRVFTMGIKELLVRFKSKKLNDNGGVELTADEVKEMIASLEAALNELASKDDEESKQQAEALQKQIDDLKSQLDVKPNDAEEQGNDDIESLKAENAALKSENEALKKELEEAKAKQDKASVLADAKSRFPKIQLNDAKTAKDVRLKVLIDNGIYTSSEANQLTDAEIRAAYAGLQAVNKPKSSVGAKFIPNDSNTNNKSASQRLGGK